MWELQVKFYLGRNEDCSPGDSVSDSSEKLLWGGKRGRTYRKVSNKGQVFGKVKRVLIIKENQICQAKEFHYVWEDERVWAHWNHSSDMRAIYLGPVSCIFTSWVPSLLTSSPSWWLKLLLTMTSLFTDMAGNIPFLSGKEETMENRESSKKQATHHLKGILGRTWTSLVAQTVKNLHATQETWVPTPGSGRSPGEGNGNTPVFLPWRNEWTEEPGRLHPMGSQSQTHNWVTNTFTFSKTNS